jgi:hypothetical protein
MSSMISDPFRPSRSPAPWQEASTTPYADGWGAARAATGPGATAGGHPGRSRPTQASTDATDPGDPAVEGNAPETTTTDPGGTDPGSGWLEGWAETWVEDDPEPVAAPQPVASTVPLVGAAPAVPPTHRVAPFAPIRAGTGRHRLSTSVRRRPGPLTAGLLVAATTLAVGSLHGPQLPFCGHAAARSPVQLRG